MNAIWHPVRVLAATAALFCGLGSTSAAEGWLILERSGTAQPEVISVVKELPMPSVQVKFPVLLEVKWGYKALPNGMPVEEELARAKVLYGGLDRIVGEKGIHAMTRTGDGGRTMYYYVEGAEGHAGAIREFFDAQPAIFVKITASKEADWVSVRKVLDAVK
jgi:hypothetical protein